MQAVTSENDATAINMQPFWNYTKLTKTDISLSIIRLAHTNTQFAAMPFNLGNWNEHFLANGRHIHCQSLREMFCFLFFTFHSIDADTWWMLNSIDNVNNYRILIWFPTGWEILSKREFRNNLVCEYVNDWRKKSHEKIVGSTNASKDSRYNGNVFYQSDERRATIK